MALDVDWTGIATNPFRIYVPQADLTVLGGGRYELDVDAFRTELKNLEAAQVGMTWTDTHKHSIEETLAGVTYARKVTVLDPYVVEFEEVGTAYEVNCVGANHNIGDVKVVNNVSLIINNSAGLIVAGGGGGGTAEEVAIAVWNRILNTTNHNILDSAGQRLRNLVDLIEGDYTATATEIIVTHRVTGAELLRKNLTGGSVIPVTAADP